MSSLIPRCAGMLFLGLVAVSTNIAEAACNSGPSRAYVGTVARAVTRTWPALDAAWPAEAPVFKSLQLVVADDHCAWLVDATTVHPLDYAKEIQQRTLSTDWLMYQKLNWPGGRPTIFVGLGKSIPAEEQQRVLGGGVPEIFSIATHESFHYFVQRFAEGQSAWKGLRVPPRHDDRATRYPLKPAPRVIRVQLIRELAKTQAGDASALARARYWSNAWLKMDAHEIARAPFYDILEGTASYIEHVANAMATGASFGSKAYNVALTKELKQLAQADALGASDESYPLGALAGAILANRVTGWQSAVVAGETPVAVLLSRIPGKPARGPADVEAAVRRAVASRNRDIGALITPWLSRFRGMGAVKLYVNTEGGGAMVSTGQYLPDGFALPITIGFSGTLRGKDRRLDAHEAILASAIGVGPCGNLASEIFLLPRPLPIAEKGRLRIKTGSLTLDMPYPSQGRNPAQLCFN